MILPLPGTSLYSLTYAKHPNCGILLETHQLQEKPNKKFVHFWLKRKLPVVNVGGNASYIMKYKGRSSCAFLSFFMHEYRVQKTKIMNKIQVYQ